MHQDPSNPPEVDNGPQPAPPLDMEHSGVGAATEPPTVMEPEAWSHAVLSAEPLVPATEEGTLPTPVTGPDPHYPPFSHDQAETPPVPPVAVDSIAAPAWASFEAPSSPSPEVEPPIAEPWSPAQTPSVPAWEREDAPATSWGIPDAPASTAGGEWSVPAPPLVAMGAEGTDPANPFHVLPSPFLPAEAPLDGGVPAASPEYAYAPRREEGGTEGGANWMLAFVCGWAAVTSFLEAPVAYRAKEALINGANLTLTHSDRLMGGAGFNLLGLGLAAFAIEALWWGRRRRGFARVLAVSVPVLLSLAGMVCLYLSHYPGSRI